MCGIGGWLGSVPEQGALATRMIQRLRRRGPDAQGERSWPEATLVHTRLSIIDLSPTGAQPMANEDGTVWTVFNGELYNHRTLRRDLEARGHRFRGHADTEILPHLYEEEGPAFVHKLRGMFALAIYDTRSRTLLLVRDRFGIKPLFYAPGPYRLAFTSEIPALLQFPDIDVRLDTQAIADFTALSYIPAPATAYRGIRALQPGEMLEAHLEGDRLTWTTRAYHQWTIAPDMSLTLAKAVEKAEALLQTAVHRQLESEVPLGALLSGGIDSSLVSAAAQARLADALQTFNVRFAEQAYDETWAAVEVAHHIGSKHLTLDMENISGSWEHLTNLFRHAGQPFGDTSLFAVHAMCQLMRRHVTVALSGDGGDEGFGGYHFYWQLARLARWQIVPPLFLHGMALLCRPLSYTAMIPQYLPDRLRDVAGSDDTALIQDLFGLLWEAEHRHICCVLDALPLRRLFEPQWRYEFDHKSSRIERLSAQATEVNIRLILANDFLFKVDLASMRESLEIRVPMLDEDLFACGLSLPHALKVSGRQGKRVLRAVAARWLPASIATKPKKGFGVPVDTWVDTACKAQIREELLSTTSPLQGLLPSSIYRPTIEAFCTGRLLPSLTRQNLYQRAMVFLSIHATLRSDAYCLTSIV
jgi:asparagine synthase (glutamine-hydrolysing)